MINQSKDILMFW